MSLGGGREGARGRPQVEQEAWPLWTEASGPQPQEIEVIPQPP